MNVGIDNEGSESPSSIWYLHALFSFIYVVLITDLVLLSVHVNDNSLTVLIVHRIARLFYEPFKGSGDLDYLEGFWPGPSIIFGLISFGLLHYGISAAKHSEADMSLMSKLLSFFRLIFYVCISLLAILIVIRAAIMTYRDLTQPRPRDVIFGIAPPRK